MGDDFCEDCLTAFRDGSRKTVHAVLYAKAAWIPRENDRIEFAAGAWRGTILLNSCR